MGDAVIIAAFGLLAWGIYALGTSLANDIRLLRTESAGTASFVDSLPKTTASHLSKFPTVLENEKARSLQLRSTFNGVRRAARMS